MLRTQWTATIVPTTDTYTLAFENYNVLDSVLDSYMGVDNVNVIPELCAMIIWSLLGALAVTVSWYRRRTTL